MASLLIGAAGSIVGGMVGGPIGAQVGWLVGSLIGNLIDPPKIEGPRRTDLKLQRAEYGAPIPRVWGTGRIAGVIIDQTDLEEHKETSGGKGGPEVTTYTYSASFDIALCVGPILGILRIWADGRLIYNIDADDELPCEVYLGTETQEPDPTFEAIHGVGSVPAYRGIAHVVFTDWMLTDYGDRIPQLEFEVFTNGGDIPWRVASFAWQVLNYNVQQVVRLDGGNFRVYLSGGTGYTSTYVKEYDRAGNQVGNTLFADATAPQMNWGPSNLGVINCRVGPTDYIWYIWNGNNLAWEQGFDASAYYLTHTTTGRSIYKNGFIYAISGTTTIAGSPSGDTDVVVRLVRWTCPDGIPGWPDGVTGNVYTNHGASGYYFGDSDDEYIYVLSQDGSGNPDGLYRFNSELELVSHWNAATLAAVNMGNWQTGNFVVHNGLIAACTSVSSNVYRIALTQINDDNTLTDVGVLLSQSQGHMWYLGGGLGLDQTGIFSLNPPPQAVTLAQVVADLSDLTSVPGYDVTELENDTVRWFQVGNQMTVRNAIETLRRGYQFDAVESDDVVKFRKRGATDSVVTLDDADLVAREYGTEGGAPLVTTRKKEQGMPRNLTVRYIDVEQDYNTGAQNSPRITTLSDTDVTLDLSIGFTADEARQIAWKLQLSDWIERESFTWQTTRKYAWVEPCDVVTVRGRVVRVTKRVETPNGVISWEGVLHRPSVYTQEAVGAPASGFVEQTTSADVVATQTVLLDIPILSQADSPFGFYAAMGPATAGNWRGAALYKSLDGGVNYSSVAATRSPAIIGNTVSSDSGSPVGSPTVSGALGTFAGDTVDESSICVRLTDPDAELVSCTPTALENGANYCAISFGNPGGSPLRQTWELCQFRDATLVEPQTYVLTGFKRGRKGSPTTGHAAGDTFVLLSTVVNVDAPEQELNLTLLYKGVTYGRTLAQTAAQEFCNTGLGAEEYFETEVEHFPIYGENPLDGSPSGQGPGLVPPIEGECDATYFLNQCGQWAVPAGSGGGGSPSGGGAIEVLDEGVSLTTAATAIDFVGAGVTATYGGGVVTVTIPGGGAGPGSPSIAGTYGDSYNVPVLTINDYGAIEGVTLAGIVHTWPVYKDGTPVNTSNSGLNFIGDGVGVVDNAGVADVTIPLKAPLDAKYFVREAHPDLSDASVLVAGTGIQFVESGGSPPGTVTVNSTVSQAGFSQAELFSSSGTFNVPTNVSIVFITGIAGGGAGGGISSVSSRGGGGGGAGEHCSMVPIKVTGGGTVSVTVPAAAAGSAGAAGANGGDVVFGSWTLKGGAGGGNAAAVGNGGAGGGSGGGAGRNVNQAGLIGTQEAVWSFGGSSGGGSGNTAGTAGTAGGPSGAYSGASGGSAGGGSTGAGGGGGASSPWGQGGAGGNGGASPGNGTTATSTNYGAGGGGGGGSGASTSTGGDGAPGFILVCWYGAP